MKKIVNKKRLERVEAVVAKEAEPEHEFIIDVGLPVEYGGTGARYFVDGKEVSEKVFSSYPKDKTGKITVELVKEEHGEE